MRCSERKRSPLWLQRESLSSPAIERVVRDPEFGDEIFDGLAGEHPLTCSAANLGGVVPWHVWLLKDRAKLSQGRSTFWGKGHARCCGKI